MAYGSEDFLDQSTLLQKNCSECKHDIRVKRETLCSQLSVYLINAYGPMGMGMGENLQCGQCTCTWIMVLRHGPFRNFRKLIQKSSLHIACV